MKRFDASLTSPTLLDTIIAFLIGNLFANFLLLLCVLIVTAQLLGLQYVLAALIVIYSIRVFSSRAQFTGSARWTAFCSSAIWASPHAYFRMQLLCDALLPPNQTYIFACAPHGIHGYGLGMLTYEGQGSLFYAKFPHLRGKLVGLVASVLFYVPIVREIFLWAGYVDAGRKTALKILRQPGRSLYFLTGGEAESLVSEPGTDRVVLAGPGRHGFVKLAIESSTLLVPVYTFHNTATYNTNTAFLGPFRKWLSKRFRVCVPAVLGRWFTPIPFNVQLAVAVGNPVPLPSGQLLDRQGFAAQGGR